ncbi:fumarylacetoacetate hydrolase family protein [Methylobacterium mesophilicum]|uniref:fumarylacetoacetate hydrolase family protein n=1 Tax=unclassified Methylobacterium TaxID=2615210 RepID=UPI0011CB313A|nr:MULTISPECIES: fumarylacetoacetate hydrolase family protein [unclassified Methylobacterium]TXN47902.1 fumarylacetoacetate hydrolase family protein [Methylobacterium sp. WL7]TXN74796.1 fumarylacetoacetate hydrolase family protein [Methylobacterium sp. WL18]
MAHSGLTAGEILPTDGVRGALVGRVWRPDVGGPSVVAIRAGSGGEARVVDVTARFATVSDLCETPDAAAALRAAEGADLGSLDAMLANTPPDGRDPGQPWLLAPVDLQALKAAGVTFATSMLERVIEERARGDLAAAAAIRTEVERLVGHDLRRLKPGSPAAMALKEVLVAQGAWSQYLEVGIGPDAEIFTKAQPLSAVGCGADAGLHPDSHWNNPEPEVALAVSSQQKIVGATLANDVNLRDFEGRSALLLGKAKDNNASCALGPFLRVFDETFDLDHVRRTTVTLEVTGTDGFRMEGTSPLAEISRDPEELVGALMGRTHDYPDGAILLLGTMFAPIQDRHGPGLGFTHVEGDRVVVASPELGSLVNRMRPCDACEPWTFGARALMRNLAARGLL